MEHGFDVLQSLSSVHGCENKNTMVTPKINKKAQQLAPEKHIPILHFSHLYFGTIILLLCFGEK
jgi:hypothetical protein